jgi:hypothetical protein
MAACIKCFGRHPHQHCPSFSLPQAADIVRVMGIGRNEYIATMVQVCVCVGVWLCACVCVGGGWGVWGVWGGGAYITFINSSNQLLIAAAAAGGGNGLSAVRGHEQAADLGCCR